MPIKSHTGKPEASPGPEEPAFAPCGLTDWFAFTSWRKQVEAGHTRDATHVEAPDFTKRGARERVGGCPGLPAELAEIVGLAAVAGVAVPGPGSGTQGCSLMGCA